MAEVLSRRTIAVSATFVVAVTVGAVLVLLWLFGGGSPRTSLDAINTATRFGIGTGGGVALLLTALRYRGSQRQLEHEKQVAAADQHHAQERHITELQGQAVDQIANDMAVVREAGLYNLERLAQSYPDHRQTIVNVLCGYLRMPHTPPEVAPTGDKRAASAEQEVRFTAQHILRGHLRPDDAEAYWGELDLPLARAVLVDFDLSDCHVRQLTLTDAEFHGTANLARLRCDTGRFDRARFRGDADFTGSRFAGEASGCGVFFGGAAEFARCRFDASGDLTEALFQAGAVFEEAVVELTGARVRIDRDGERRWPPGWSVHEPTGIGADQVPGRAGRWAELVRDSADDQQSVR